MSSRFFSSPWRALRDTPLTSGMTLTIALYHFWLGTVLIRVAAHLLPIQQVGYRGPLSLCTLSTWGWWHIAAGCIGLVRMFVHNDYRLNLALHLVSMSVILAWAIAFDLGPPTTGQPAYTFVAVVSFFSIFMVRVIERRYGRARPALKD